MIMLTGKEIVENIHPYISEVIADKTLQAIYKSIDSVIKRLSTTHIKTWDAGYDRGYIDSQDNWEPEEGEKTRPTKEQYLKSLKNHQ